MTREEAKVLLPLIQLYSEGEEVQLLVNNKWEDLDPPVMFNRYPELYRIKPKEVEA